MQLIEFTPSAIEAIIAYKKTLNIPEGFALRVGIKQKNAQDKSLLIGFDTKTEKDKAIKINGIDIIFNADQIFFFAGMLIDFIEQNGRKGFKLVEKAKLQSN